MQIAHLSWATWAIRSRSLISLERPEWFAHGRSFLLRDLSNSLTVAHFSWAIWANRSQSLISFERNERMSEFPALKIFCYVAYRDSLTRLILLTFNTVFMLNCSTNEPSLAWIWIIWTAVRTRASYCRPNLQMRHGNMRQKAMYIV